MNKDSTKRSNKKKYAYEIITLILEQDKDVIFSVDEL